MTNVLAPLIFLVLVLGLYFSYLTPGLEVKRELETQSARQQGLIKNQGKYKRDLELKQSDLQAISPTDKKILDIFILPDRVDVVQTVIDIDALASQHALRLNTFDVTGGSGGRSNKQENTSNTAVGSKTITLNLAGGYADFKNFLRDVETSQSLMDVTALTVSGSNLPSIGSSTSEHVFSVTLRKYLLKEQEEVDSSL